MPKLFTLILKPSGRIAKWLILVFLIVIFTVGALGFLDPVRLFLDKESLGFKIGSYQLTPYELIKSVLAGVIVFWLAAIVSDFGEGRIKKIKGMRAGNRVLLTKLFQIGLYFFATLFVLDAVGIDLTALAVFSGALGVGLGFGLQKITANFISGLILLFEKSIEPEDMVEMNDGTVGIVRRTSARYTLVETYEGKEIMIPNEDFITNRVINWTYTNTRGRVEIPIGVSYESDIEKAQKLILEAAREHPRCSKEKEPECHLRSFADSSITFILFFWVDDVTEGRSGAQSDVMFSIWRKFKENDISMPFPQRDIYIKNIERIKELSSV